MNGWAYRGYPLQVSSTYHGPGAISLASASAPPQMAMPAVTQIPHQLTASVLPTAMPALPATTQWPGY